MGTGMYRGKDVNMDRDRGTFLHGVAEMDRGTAMGRGMGRGRGRGMGRGMARGALSARSRPRPPAPPPPDPPMSWDGVGTNWRVLAPKAPEEFFACPFF